MQPLSANYRFDPWTAVLTLIVAPVVFLIFRIIARYLKVWSAFATEGLLHRSLPLAFLISDSRAAILIHRTCPVS